MARGSPDWYRGFETFGGEVRITLANAYDRVRVDSYTGGIPGAEWTTIHNISGQGEVRGGFIQSLGAASCKTDQLRITVDGDVLRTDTWNGINIWGFDQGVFMPWIIRVFDDLGFNYHLFFKEYILFKSSLLIEYNCVSENLQSFGARLYYTIAPT